MKYLLIIGLIYSGITSCYGQAKGTVVLPVFKEGKAIDNLIDIIKTKPYPQGNDNYILMLFFKQKDKNGFIFQIEQSALPFANRSVFDLAAPGFNYGYFEYQNKKVFFSTGGKLNDFFTKTAQNKTINFINNPPKTDPRDPADPQHTQLYIYKNGHFSNYVPPVITLIKN